jgi:hypothetical protein
MNRLFFNSDDENAYDKFFSILTDTLVEGSVEELWDLIKS